MIINDIVETLVQFDENNADNIIMMIVKVT